MTSQEESERRFDNHGLLWAAVAGIVLTGVTSLAVLSYRQGGDHQQLMDHERRIGELERYGSPALQGMQAQLNALHEQLQTRIQQVPQNGR